MWRETAVGRKSETLGVIVLNERPVPWSIRQPEVGNR